MYNTKILEEDWYDDAECRGTDPQLFFGEGAFDRRVLPRDPDRVRKALALCAVCDVEEECLDFAIEMRQDYGIWGGMTDRQRKKERKRRTKNAAKL